MKNKLSNKVVASFVVAGIVLSDGQIINAIDNNIEATTLSQNETNTENSTDQTNEIVGQSKFVDENGNVKVVNVYDGTTGEQYNPNERLVETANMVNFNCSKAGKTTKYIDYYTGQDGYLSKSSAADAAYLGMENGKVKFMVSGVVGLVDLNQVEIVTQGKYYASNYEVNSKGKLYHYISNNVNATGNQGNYNYVGEAPSYLSRGIEYYSYDGHYFYTNYEVMIKDYKNNVRSNSVNPNNPYYSYFQYLPLRSKTNYSAMQLTTYMNKKADSASSKLNDTGELFIKYQNQYGVNALMAMSFAALESGWGKSNIAIEKNNLFGLNATDANPNEDASKYATVEDCIRDFTANWMSKRYLNATYTNRFRGGYFGDKGSGIFGQYSSDPYEGEKCAAIAANMDAGISGADKNYYTIGIKDANMTTHTGLNVRKEGNTNSNVLYTTIKNPAYAFIVRKKEAVNGFYEIQSDSVLTNSRDDVSDTAEYDYNNNYAYVSNNYITIINDGNNIEYTPVIEKVEVIDITSEGYTVNCKVNDDVQIDRVMMPTWTEKNNQDDLNWYTASKNGDVYTVRVTTSNHKKESGKYNTHIYVYDNEGSVTKEELQIDVPEAKAPEIKDVKVSTPTRGGYTVTCTVESNSELTRVQMPTWTEKNNQDDLVWHDAKVEKIADRKYEVSYTVKTEDHNKESGKYITHIYAYDVNGKTACYEIGEINVPENQAPVIEEAYISDITSEGYTVNCKVNDDVQIDRVMMPTWTEKNNQDDLNWYTASKNGDVYTVRVTTSNHKKESGKYNTHIYVYDNEGSVTKEELQIDVPEAKAPEIKDVKVSTPTRGGYTVTCTVESNSELTRVQMPTWTEKNNQDDLVWHDAKVEKIADRKYEVSYTVKTEDHNKESGKYITHIYAYDVNGKTACYEIGEINVPENQAPVIEEAYISDITSEGYTVNCKVSDDVQIDRVIVPTWTEVSGQDDMIWHEANYVDGIWQVKVIRKDHQYEYGKYTSHVYVYDDDGAYTVHGFDPVNLEEPDFIDGVPHIQNVKITDANDDGYTVTCKVTDDKQITKVLMPTWTYKNNQDELVWHEAKKISDDTYTCRIQRSDHKYEFGTYITHIYAYDIDGNEAKVELNYHNIVNTTVDQGWRYIDGQKYFFDDMGNIAGNMPSKKVIDVSLYNGVIDWETVARYGDIDGVIIRIVQHPNGSYIEDSQFANNLAGCRKYGIPFGVYIYDYSNNTADAFNEAELVTSILKKYNISSEELTYPVYFDMERNVHTTQQMTDNAAVFINQMSNHGYEANIYSYRSLLNEFLNSQYIWSKTSWLAAYTKTMGWENPHYHGKFGWQYTSSGVIPGINGSVDISCWFEI